MLASSLVSCIHLTLCTFICYSVPSLSSLIKFHCLSCTLLNALHAHVFHWAALGGQREILEFLQLYLINVVCIFLCWWCVLFKSCSFSLCHFNILIFCKISYRFNSQTAFYIKEFQVLYRKEGGGGECLIELANRKRFNSSPHSKGVIFILTCFSALLQFCSFCSTAGGWACLVFVLDSLAPQFVELDFLS